jgi:hypothetical protein
MIELQPSALDVRTSEHARRVHDVNRTSWMRRDAHHAEPRMVLRRVLRGLRPHLTPNTGVNWEAGRSARPGVAVVGDSVLGTA